MNLFQILICSKAFSGPSLSSEVHNITGSRFITEPTSAACLQLRPEKVLVSVNHLISAFPLTAIILSQCLPIDQRLKTTLCYHTKMFSRPSFAVFLCVVILIGFSSGKPQNPSIKPTVNGHQDKSFVVNNNCGLSKSESEMLAHIKAKVDSIAAKSSKGIFLLNYCKSPKFSSYRSLLVCTTSYVRFDEQ